MLDEIQEWKAYTDKGQNRLQFSTLAANSGLNRVMQILARGFLFPPQDEQPEIASASPGEEETRFQGDTDAMLRCTVRFLQAWCGLWDRHAYYAKETAGNESRWIKLSREQFQKKRESMELNLAAEQDKRGLVLEFSRCVGKIHVLIPPSMQFSGERAEEYFLSPECRDEILNSLQKQFPTKCFFSANCKQDGRYAQVQDVQLWLPEYIWEMRKKHVDKLISAFSEEYEKDAECLEVIRNYEKERENWYRILFPRDDYALSEGKAVRTSNESHADNLTEPTSLQERLKNCGALKQQYGLAKTVDTLTVRLSNLKGSSAQYQKKEMSVELDRKPDHALKRLTFERSIADALDAGALQRRCLAWHGTTISKKNGAPIWGGKILFKNKKMTNKQSVRLLMALAYFHLNCYDQREAVINKSDLANWMQCKPDQIQLEQYTFTTNDSPSPKRVFLTSEQGTQNVLKFCLNEDFIEPEEWKIQPYEEDIACYQDVGSGSLVWSPGKAT